jgi:Family of unknown function (DUF5832)
MSKQNNRMMMEETEEEKVDFLEVDSEIPGQNYVCLSFISPEKVIQQKQTYLMTHFMKWIFSGVENSEDPVSKSGFEKKKILEELGSSISYQAISDMYEDFRLLNEEALSKKFAEENDFRTSVRGVKIRGVYNTVKEAKARSQVIRRRDPNFNVFVGQVGYWLPWDPECQNIEEVEYQEQHLNELMKKYNENVRHRDELYEKQKQDRLEAIRKNTAAKAEETVKNEKTIIEELRTIADKKEQIIVESGGSLAEKAETEQQEKGKGPATATAAKKDSAIFDDGPHADPWMEAKSGSMKKKIGTGSGSALPGQAPLSVDECVATKSESN